MATLLQLVFIGFPIAYVVMMILAFNHVRRQGLSERELLLWDLIILFVPFGGLLVFFYFPDNRRR